jgi:hypothetical protein
LTERLELAILLRPAFAALLVTLRGERFAKGGDGTNTSDVPEEVALLEGPIIYRYKEGRV